MILSLSSLLRKLELIVKSALLSCKVFDEEESTQSLEGVLITLKPYVRWSPTGRTLDTNPPA